MKICGLDFETTGLDTEKALITEIGAIMWDASDNWKELARFQTLVWEPEYAPLTKEIVEITGITDEELKKKGIHPKEAITKLGEFCKGASYMMAHNKQFDKGILEGNLKRYFGSSKMEKKWICSRVDVPYPKRFRCKHLSHLALDHGYAVDPTITHRADYDVSLIAEIMKHGNYTLPQILDYATAPWVFIQANVNYDNREKAKKAGFGWQTARGTDKPTFSKTWVHRLKENEVDEFTKGLDFQWTILKKEEVQL